MSEIDIIRFIPRPLTSTENSSPNSTLHNFDLIYLSDLGDRFTTVGDKLSSPDGWVGTDRYMSQVARLVRRLPTQGYHQISTDDEYRIDKISHKIYGSVKYWWLLLLHSNVSIADLKSGNLLPYPEKEFLDSLLREIRRYFKRRSSTL